MIISLLPFGENVFVIITEIHYFSLNNLNIGGRINISIVVLTCLFVTKRVLKLTFLNKHRDSVSEPHCP